jgi:hypothetical protein
MTGDWLRDLDEALFARLPRSEELDVGDRIVQVYRSLDETTDGLKLTERWHDTRTEAVVNEWAMRLNAAAFVGVPAWLLQQAIDVVLKALPMERPRPRRRVERPTLNPGRFAHGGPSAQPKPR